MKIHELPPLPYEYGALEPIISKETLEFHHDKHQRAYVDKLNKLIPGSPFENALLDEIVLKADGSIFNQAAQVWNHSFYWKSMNPYKKAISGDGALAPALVSAFGTPEQFKEKFEKCGESLFGSGWLWLVSDSKAKLQLLVTKDAGNPIRDGLTPLLVCDLWEHAYYIDYRNARPKYLSSFYDIIDWDYAEANYSASMQSMPHSNKGRAAYIALHE